MNSPINTAIPETLLTESPNFCTLLIHHVKQVDNDNDKLLNSNPTSPRWPSRLSRRKSSNSFLSPTISQRADRKAARMDSRKWSRKRRRRQSREIFITSFRQTPFSAYASNFKLQVFNRSRLFRKEIEVVEVNIKLTQLSIERTGAQVVRTQFYRKIL